MLTAITRYNSPLLIATILPNRKLLKLAAFLINPDKTPARPIPADIMIAMDISENLGIFLRIASIPIAATTQAAAAVKTGFSPRSSPAATPASEVWDRASPIMDRRLHTITSPIHGMMAARRMPTIKARCMNAYSKISMLSLLSAWLDQFHLLIF